MARNNADRSLNRRVTVLFRTSPAGRAELKARAQAHGVSLQTYLEAVAFGRPMVPDGPSGPTSRQGLPLTG